MIDFSSRRSKRFVLIFMILAAFGSVARAEHRQMKEFDVATHELLSSIRSSTANRRILEDIFQSNLKLTSESKSFKTYKSDNFKYSNLAVSLELREPIPDSSAKIGPLFIVNILEGCASVSEMRNRYAPWTLFDVPRGHSLDEEISWSHREPWGDLRIAYREHSPDCLTAVVFEVNKP